MENENNDEVIVDTEEAPNEEVEEVTEETPPKAEKPKRTPQEELEYFEGRAARLRKKLGAEEQKTSPETKKTVQTDKPNDLDYGEKAYLRSALDLKGADELQLAKDWKGKYGTTVEEMEADEVFLSRLTKLRQTRESAMAVPKGKNRSGQTGVSDVDFAVAKFKETGEFPSDFKTRSAVVKALEAEELSSGMFEGSSVIGKR